MRYDSNPVMAHESEIAVVFQSIGAYSMKASCDWINSIGFPRTFILGTVAVSLANEESRLR